MVAVLVILTTGVFGQLGTHEFVRYDDNLYVTDNPRVQPGLTWPGFVWAFTSRDYAANYHPVT